MEKFTVGDRCLVHNLESEAGQPLNGQHVTLADAIIEKGRFKCKFDDGSFACIKPCNLQIIHGDRVNQKTNSYEKDPSSNQYLDWQTTEIKEILGGLVPNWNPELEGKQTWTSDPKKRTRRLAGSGHRKATVGKCTFCVHRLEKGVTETACQQACPTSAIIFGDLDDANSDVSKAIVAAGSAVFRLKTEAKTKPTVYFLGESPSSDARLVEIVPVEEGVQLEGDASLGGGTVPWK